MKNKVLVVVAHSDDETFGMGGTLKKHANNKDDVFVVSMTDGVSSRNKQSKKIISERKKSSLNAGKILGFKWKNCFDFPDNALDSIPMINLIKSLEEVKDSVSPNIVYTHSSKDLNIDHRIISQAVQTVFRPQPNEICREIRLFEVPSATDFGNESLTGSFLPNLFLDITKTWKEKKLASLAYKKELKDYPHSRSLKGLENLAKIRGNQVGLEMAEAFEIIRKIEI